MRTNILLKLPNSWNVLFIVFAVIVMIGVCYYVESYLSKNKNKSKFVKSGIKDIDYMDGFQFEQYLAYMFRANDYKVQVTSERKNFGADLIIKKSGAKIVVQAKREKAKVGIKAIQEIVVAQNHYKAEEFWVITNNFYTKGARELAESNNVKLLDRYKLIELMTALNLSVSMTAGEFKQKVKAKPIKCVCGAQMVSKKNRHSGRSFYGCTTYPKCSHTKSIL
ncbi:restriction endonuclease [Bacillus safensis]|uniref:restriction endonuclease n=1 Tax=Bacillus safensis TaxID=561879 RepID=UPI00227E9249|nr:restriction endonuclease [Bacillus safensis]MCY7704698.1 restriction endonuclease [Bacillus safensis]MCY7720457.1 restriction endonuclease [Bacillus safensis]MED0727300.1 restriction endonuclease [Bacillus safensis]